MPAGAPKGNQNGAKAKVWSAAISRALDKRTKLEGKQALDALAEQLLANCDSGDMTALKELGDRLEGRPQQSIVGADDGPLTIQIVKYAGSDPE